eukprot:CAMPEP_0170201676 /NCGR_PEP_ID=MMETSP0116_2-20130129/296_1 /TAXON_ID=400756 /ORGANISM="Durinskia baltica, Strain CSIRO CS-38" /LENGTH=302 /DNA_ID=CAMNT_0010451895 /DNA_START=1 /DNA_END=906 /DNA_ORIENTATION=+
MGPGRAAVFRLRLRHGRILGAHCRGLGQSRRRLPGICAMERIVTEFVSLDSYRHLAEGPLAATAQKECPLGVLFLRIVLFYEAFAAGTSSQKDLVSMANTVQKLLSSFPTYAIALSRWPVFHALDHFAPHHKQQSKLFCDGARGVLDWSELRKRSLHWYELKRTNPDAPEFEDLERWIGDQFFHILRKVDRQNLAQEECEFGFYFLVANQVAAAASRETHHLPPFNRIMDQVMATRPFSEVAACGWPIFQVLVIFADLNKGLKFWGGDRKYLRGYTDWNLRRDELSPLVPSRLDFLSSAWRE